MMRKMIASLVLLLIGFGATGCFGIFLGDNQLWPPPTSLTGRWEGTLTFSSTYYNEGWRGLECSVMMVLSEQDAGVITGSAVYTCGSKIRGGSVLGTRSGDSVMLYIVDHMTGSGGLWRISGQVDGNTLTGTDVGDGSVLELTRVE